MFGLLCAALLAQQQKITLDSGVYLPDPASGEETALLFVRRERLEPPKLSPRKFPPTNERWEFDWLTAGYGKPTTSPNQELRLRVFSQQRRAEADEAAGVARIALRLWALGYRKLKIDHPLMGRGVRNIDFYLCWGGQAGGEQRVEEDVEAGIARRVNVVYLYDLASFKDPLEMAREVAHEYGHAVLPAVGGFKAPEDWANGYLGERLYLRWLRDGMRSGILGPADALGVSSDELDGWVRAKVDPSMDRAALEGPNVKTLAASGPKALDHFLGLATYAESLLPSQAFAKSLQIVTRPADYPDALVEAAKGHGYVMQLPARFKGKSVWIPLGRSKVEGAKIVKRAGGWAQVALGAKPVIVTGS